MKKKYVILTVLGLIMAFAFVLAARAMAQQSGLPNITFLGEGPGTFTVEPPRQLLVKTYEDGEFLFVIHDETSYEAEEDERVWSTDFLPEDFIRLLDEEVNFGDVQAGCLVNYVQIEDNEDDRINTWYINDAELQVVQQGWVTYGSFTVPEDGELTFFAEDSVGMIAEVCVGGVPTETEAPPKPTFTNTATEVVASPTVTSTPPLVIIPSDTPTATQVPPTNTPTATLVPPTNTPTATQVPPTNTATATQVVVPPTNTATATQVIVPPTNTPTVTSTPLLGILPTNTNTPVPTITLTPVPTPGVIPPTGGGPGPREISLIGLGLLSALGLASFGWWRLIHGNRYGR